MKAFKSTRAIAIAGVLSLGVAGYAQTYDFASSFSITNGNPNGEWSYGYMTAGGGAFNLFTTTHQNGDITAWYTPGLSGDFTPSVYKNGTGSPINNLAPGEVALHSGPSGESGVARFTAPFASEFTIVGEFGQGDIGAVDLFVMKNGTNMFSVNTTTTAHQFNLSTPLVAGDTIDFVVGYAGSNGFDTTPLSATITAVPEPATMAALGLGFAALLRRGRRR